MFSQKSIIEASRQFVCVRLETYENKFHQEKIREVLNGTFQNSAFTILDIDGKTQLTGNARMPMQGLIGRKTGSPEQALDKMNEIAAKYPIAGEPGDAVLQDFHTFRQALNIASADQRLLLFTVAPESDFSTIRSTLRPVMNHPEVKGKFHLDIGNSESDQKWSESLRGVNHDSGYFIIRADTFGQTGQVVSRLPLSAAADEIKSSLHTANKSFAEAEQRKAYAAHVTEGREKGIYFKQAIPFGEDRDGDGQIDNPKARRLAEQRAEDD